MAALFSPTSKTAAPTPARLNNNKLSVTNHDYDHDHDETTTSRLASKSDRNSDSDTGGLLSSSHHQGGKSIAVDVNSEQHNLNLNKHTATIYDVEHLATFSTSDSADDRDYHHQSMLNGDDRQLASNGDRSNPAQTHRQRNGRLKKSKNLSVTKPRVALENLFELEKVSGIWTQRMQIQLSDQFMLIIDCETNSIVERFEKSSVVRPEAFREYNDIYSNIIVFTIKQNSEQHQLASSELDQLDSESSCASLDDHHDDDDQEESATSTNDELHIFQCVSHKAQQLVTDILAWKRRQASGNKLITESGSLTATASDRIAPGDMANGERDDKKPGPPASDHKNNSIHHLPLEQQQQQQTDNSKAAASSQQHRAATTPSSTASDNVDPSEQQQQQQQSNSNKSSTSEAQKPPSGGGAKNGKPPVVVTAAAATSANETPPIVNVNVKETVQVFNQIAALREKSKPSSPTNNNGTANNTRPLSDASLASSQESKNQSAGLGSGGQLYKQRSIRAILAPKLNQTNEPKGHPKDQQQQATSNKRPAGDSSSLSSSSIASSGSNANANVDPQQQQKLDAANKTRQSENKFAPANNIAARQQQQQQANPKAASSQHRNPAKQTHQSNGSSNNNANSNLSNSSSSASSSRAARNSLPTPLNQQQLEQVTTNESYVSVLNHCFDDIEKFIIRLQHAAAAMRELQIKRKLSKRSNQHMTSPAAFANAAGNYQPNIKPPNGLMNPTDQQQQQPQQPPIITASELAMLSAKARGPNEDDYFEILSKFKLAFNLLAKLKGCIHEPNAPELVHFLFTPLAIIIESARNVTPPIDPTLVGIPYLNRDALELLSNCCTSKESDMWHSLGPNWTQTIDTSLLIASRLPSSFQPIFSDGWAPIITELELIGLVLPQAAQPPSTDNNNGDTNSASEQQHYQSQRYLKSSMAAEPDSEAAGGGAYRTPAKLPPLSSSGQHRSSRLRSGSSPPVSSHSSGRLLAPAQPFDADDVLSPYDNQGPYGYPMAGRNHQNNSRSKSSSRRPMRDADFGAHGNQVPYQHMNMIHPMQPAPQHDLLDYPNNGLMVPSDDYTELQTDHTSAGPSSHYRRSRHSDYSMAGSRVSHYQSGASDEAINRARRRSSSKHPTGNYYPPPTDHHPQLPRHHQQKQRAFSQQQLYMHDDDGLLMFQDEQEREAMLADLGPAQTEWFLELQARGALIVRVLFSREANKDKELSVRRGEVLEILDDTRKWWKARNIDLQVAYVPHTIVAVVEHYQTLDELLLTSQDAHHQPVEFGSQAAMLDPMAYVANNNNHQQPSQRTARHKLVAAEQMFDDEQLNFSQRKDKRNAKTAGAFRYF